MHAPSPSPQPNATLTLTLDPDASRGSLFLFDGDTAPRGAVMMVPALSVPARSYFRLGAALRARGLAFAVVELRGVGSSPLRARRGVDWGYLDLVDGELQAMFTALARRWPDTPRLLCGHSLGGHLVLLHQARHPHQAADLLGLVASGSPWQRNYAGWRRGLVAGFAALSHASSRALGVFRGDWFSFGGRQGARLMQEWARYCRDGRLPPLGAAGWDPQPALAALERPLFSLSMAGDHYAPASATAHLASSIRARHRAQRLERLPDGRAPGHFSWMRQPDPVAEHLDAALAAR